MGTGQTKAKTKTTKNKQKNTNQKQTYHLKQKLRPESTQESVLNYRHGNCNQSRKW